MYAVLPEGFPFHQFYIICFNQELHLSLAKSYRRQGKADLALPHAIIAHGNQWPPDNGPLAHFVAHTAALAGEFTEAEKYAQMVLDYFSHDTNLLNVVSYHNYHYHFVLMFMLLFQ